MISKDAIEAALAAHAQWKKRLQDAIATGQSEFKADVVSRDNACQFGQWLYSLSKEDTASNEFQTIKSLHADFHKTAGEILELALAGKKDEALKRLNPGGSYGQVSGKLVLALNDWKSKV